MRPNFTRGLLIVPLICAFLFLAAARRIENQAPRPIQGGPTHQESAVQKALREKEMAARSRDADCVSDCQQRLRDKVQICDDLFNSPGSSYYHDTVWHNGCLANARTEFDDCLSTCGTQTSLRSNALQGKGSGHADEIVRDRESSRNEFGSPKAAPLTSAGVKILSGPSSCDVWFDNYTGYWIDVYIDGQWYGTMSPWGGFMAYNVAAGERRLYGQANFTNGTYDYWGPYNLACNAYATFHWQLMP